MKELLDEIWKKSTYFEHRYFKMPGGVVLSVIDFKELEFQAKLNFSDLYSEQLSLFGMTVYTSNQLKKGEFKLCLPDDF